MVNFTQINSVQDLEISQLTLKSFGQFALKGQEENQ